VANQREISPDALLDGGIRQAFGHAVAVRLVGQLRADLG
jgi:hypothetical protein